MDMGVLEGRRDAGGGYKVDTSRVDRVDRVSLEWFSRPDDERYLSLDDLFASVRPGGAERDADRGERRDPGRGGARRSGAPGSDAA
jgi:hypothetical protein